MSRLPFEGLTLAVTRPLAQAAPLAAQIQSRGGTALVVPLLLIEAALDEHALQAVAARLSDYQFAVFVSQNAVAHAAPVLARTPWPCGVQAVAMGPASAAALKAFGVHDVILPAGPFDSETLLTHPALQADKVAGARVVILRGDGGRDVLAAGLQARGATVEFVQCYTRRASHDVAPLIEALGAGALDAITLTSSEALRHLCLHAAQTPGLMHVPLFVPHQRIHDLARAAGFATVVLTPPGDAGLLLGVEQYFQDQAD